MRTQRRATISELRQAVECLPRRTKIAMLEGISSNDIIVGAYADGRGVCPMLAAHRAGGRTSLISFAHAWDRFAFRDSRAGVARRATDRELRVLRTHLEASLLEEEVPATALQAAIAEHRELVARQPRGKPRSRPGDPDRSQELRDKPGWAWLRVFRRLDDYEGALERVRAAQLEQEPERELVF
jgi:hypothetical protein